MPEFYNNLAEVAAIISGAVSTVFAGNKLLEVALKDEAWASTTVTLGAIFLDYGGSSIIQMVMFLFESLWTILMFTQATEIGLAPFVIAYLMQTNYSSLGGSIGDELNTVYLMWSLLMAFGSFVGAWALAESADIMLDYYDITGSGLFQSYEDVTKDVQLTKAMFFTDLIHHVIMVLSYFALAAGVADGAFAYVYFSVTGQEIDLDILAL